MLAPKFLGMVLFAPWKEGAWRNGVRLNQKSAILQINVTDKAVIKRNARIGRDFAIVVVLGAVGASVKYYRYLTEFILHQLLDIAAALEDLAEVMLFVTAAVKIQESQLGMEKEESKETQYEQGNNGNIFGSPDHNVNKVP